MNYLPHCIPFPRNFFNSWQYLKIVSLHGTRMAERCALTLMAMLCHCSESARDGHLTPAVAMDLARAVNPRDKRAVLWAMRQANLVALIDETYRVLLVSAAQKPLALEQPTEQLDLALEQPGLALEQVPRAPRRPHRIEKTQQNQASRLARAGAMSATKPEKTPLIDQAPCHTELKAVTSFSEVSFTGERSEPDTDFKEATNVVSLAKKIAQKSQAKAAGLRAEPRSSTLTAGTVEPIQLPPRSLERGVRFLEQRVTVEARESSSAVFNGNLALEMQPMPAPDAAYVVALSRKLWPQDPLSRKFAMRFEEQNVTMDELEAAEENIMKQRKSGKNPGPPLLLYVVGDIRKEAEAKAQRKAWQSSQGGHPQGNNGDKFFARKRKRDRINALMGDERMCHHVMLDPYLDDMEPHDEEIIVSLYCEMDAEDGETEWPAVGSALLAGRLPKRTGLRPAASNPEIRKEAMAKIHALFSNVQTIDKPARAS